MNDIRALGPNATVAVTGSLIVNLALWCALATGTNRHIFVPPQTMIEVSRVEIDQNQKVTPKVIKPEEIKKQVKKIREVHKQKPTPEKPPPPSHNKIITAPTPGPTPEPAVLAGGNADLGKKDQTQDTGTGKAPTPQPQPAPRPPDPKPAPPVTPPLRSRLRRRSNRLHQPRRRLRQNRRDSRAKRNPPTLSIQRSRIPVEPGVQEIGASAASEIAADGSFHGHPAHDVRERPGR